MKKYMRLSDEDVRANEAELAKIKFPSEPSPDAGGGGGGGGGSMTPPKGETPPEGEKEPELPPLKLPPPEEVGKAAPAGEKTPSAGGEAASGMDRFTPKSFSSKIVKSSDLHQPSGRYITDLFTSWKLADSELVRKYDSKNSGIL
jgi:hypothetical protein